MAIYHEDRPAKTVMLFQCYVCTSSFTMKKNLYVHLRTIHQVVPEMSGKMTCPLHPCDARFRTLLALRTHLTDAHEQVIESEQHQFEDSKTFEGWRGRLEEESGFSYVRRISEKRLSGGEVKTYYICQRSGAYRFSQEKQKRSSSKMGATCPSVMEVSRFPRDGTIKVLFWKTHFGHGQDTKRPPQRKHAKKKAEVLPSEVCVVVPAAGTGQRMGPGTPKQYVPVHQKPLICYTVEAFLRLPFVKKVVVVASPDSLERMLHTLSRGCALEGDKLLVTEGATHRHASIRSGLKALETCTHSSEVQPEVVVIHDGVRPFFTEDIVSSVVLAAKEHGAAGVTCPLVSTVISVDENGFLDSSLDRSKFRASEMPQAFNYDLLCQAYDKCSAHDLEFGTECLHLMQKYMGIKAKLLPGTSHLWKVTHHKDIYTAAAVVKESQSVGIVCSYSRTSLSSVLKKCLSQTFESVHLVSGKQKEDALSRFPNVVWVCDDPDPYPTLERLSSLGNHPPTQPASLAHVFARPLHPTLNFLELQRQARECARQLKGLNVLVYFITVHEELAEPYEELAELVRSLLFDSNPNISGNVFLS